MLIDLSDPYSELLKVEHWLVTATTVFFLAYSLSGVNPDKMVGADPKVLASMSER